MMKVRLSFCVPVLFCLLVLIKPFTASAAENDKIGIYFEESFSNEAAEKYDASLNSVLKILRIDQKNYLATLRAGWLSYLRGDQTSAEKYYRRTIDLAPGAVEPRLGLLLPLIAGKRWAEAESAARAALKIDGKNYTAMSKLGFVLFQQEKYEEARTMYQGVLDNYPSDVEMKLGLAWTFQRLGRKDEAKRYFLEVLEVYRTNQSGLQGMEILKK
ncbi:MAG: tetratricopeptide repeat protein [Desulfobacteraceae bacterium]|nr:MAG: tetratricopeptide repeat protein [Desulfobacteraceae bacterium]